MTVRLTVRHHFDFGAQRALVGDDLVDPDAWDALRMGDSDGFALPATRAAWEAAAEARSDLVARAAALDAWASATSVGRLCSYGCGTGALEWLLHREDPARRLTLTEYAPRTRERLAALFPEVTVLAHDLRRDPPVAGQDVHLLHRIDTELPNAAWREVFARFGGVRVLVVATELIGLRDAGRQIVGRLRHPTTTRAGWVRSRSAFEALWRDTHAAQALTMHDLPAWDLRPRRGPA